jgi:hypothetical protein
MSRSILVFALLLMLLVVPFSVAALTVTQTTFTDGASYSFSEMDTKTSISFTVTGMNTMLYNYQVITVMGRDIDLYPPVVNGTYSGAYTGDVVIQNFTASPVSVIVHPSYYPFEYCENGFLYGVYERYKTNNSIHASVSSTLTFNISGADLNYTYHISFDDCDPVNLDTGASDAIGRGVYVDIYGLKTNSFHTTYTNIPISFFLTDDSTDHNLIAYGTGSLYYRHNGSVMDTYNNTYAYGFKPNTFTLCKNYISWNQSYYIFMGTKLGSTYTELNTIISTPDGSVQPTNFTVENYNVGGNVAFGTSSYTNDYIGCVIYFEPGFYDSGSTMGGITPGTLGLIVRNWGVSIGVPYFHIVIAFLIAAIIALIPFSIALQYDLNMPNFIYGIFIAVGVTLDFGIGLIELWMYGMFVLFVILTIILRYQEQVQKLITHDKIVTMPTKKKVSGLLGLPAYKGQKDYTREEKIAMSRAANRPHGEDWMNGHQKEKPLTEHDAFAQPIGIQTYGSDQRSRMFYNRKRKGDD